MENIFDLSELQSLATLNTSSSKTEFAKKKLAEIPQCHSDLNQIWNNQKDIEEILIKKIDCLWKNDSEKKKQCIELEEQVQQLDKEKQNLLARVNSIERKIKILDEELVEAKEAQLKLAEKFAFENERDKSVLDLLRNVTQIRFEENQASDLLQGVFTSSSDIQPFSYDLNKHSKHDIMGELWGQMNKGKEFLTS